jgi:hypothetical protein
MLLRARGIATLVEKLVREEGVPAAEILVLLRGDYRGAFSHPIKQEFDRLGVAYSDPDAVERLLAEPTNRRTLAIRADGVSDHSRLRRHVREPGPDRAMELNA